MNEWPVPPIRCLSGLDEDIRSMIADHPVNLLEVRTFENLEWFRSDIREVFGFLKHAQDKAKLESFVKKNEKTFRAMDWDAYALLSSMSGMAQLAKSEASNLEKGEKCDMFKAIMEIREEGIKEDEERLGVLVRILLKNGRSAEIEIGLPQSHWL